MYTKDDIGKIVSDKNGTPVKLVAQEDEDASCSGCFYSSDRADSCNPVRNDFGLIGCGINSFIFVKQPNLSSDYKQSKLYWHEALDRSHVACDHFHEYVAQHPAIENNSELKASALAVTSVMQDFYQLVCRKSSEFEGKRHQ